MSALLLAIFLLDGPPATAPASPAPAASDAKRDKSLGAAAAKRAPGKKKAPPKVLTNDDLDKARQGDAAVSVLAGDGADPGSEGNPVTSSELEPADSIPRDEATWRQRADAVRMRISQAEAEVTQGEQRLTELRNDLMPEDPMNPFRQQTRDAEIKAQTERLEAARAELAAARQSMSDLEDEARRASIPPGWLREAQPR
jgi:hypothetical protein